MREKQLQPQTYIIYTDARLNAGNTRQVISHPVHDRHLPVNGPLAYLPLRESM